MLTSIKDKYIMYVCYVNMSLVMLLVSSFTVKFVIAILDSNMFVYYNMYVTVTTLIY